MGHLKLHTRARWHSLKVINFLNSHRIPWLTHKGAFCASNYSPIRRVVRFDQPNVVLKHILLVNTAEKVESFFVANFRTFLNPHETILLLFELVMTRIPLVVPYCTNFVHFSGVKELGIFKSAWVIIVKT